MKEDEKTGARSMFRTVVALVLIMLLFLPQGGDAQAVRVHGLDVSMEPPKGFVVDTKMIGFRSKEASAGIMVKEMPFPYSKMKEIAIKGAEKNAEQYKMTILSQDDNKESNPPYLLYHLEGKTNGIIIRHWMILTGTEKFSVTADGMYPKDSEAELSESIKKSLLTLRVIEAKPTDIWKKFSFRIQPTAKMKIVGKFANDMVLTRTGKIDDKGRSEPYYVIEPYMKGRVNDLKIFAQIRISKEDKLKNLRNIKGKAMTINGNKAYEMRGDADDIKTGVTMCLYQVGIQGKDQDYLIRGIVMTNQSNEYLPEFRRLTATFRTVDLSKNTAK